MSEGYESAAWYRPIAPGRYRLTAALVVPSARHGAIRLEAGTEVGVRDVGRSTALVSAGGHAGLRVPLRGLEAVLERA